MSSSGYSSHAGGGGSSTFQSDNKYLGHLMAANTDSKFLNNLTEQSGAGSGSSESSSSSAVKYPGALESKYLSHIETKYLQQQQDNSNEKQQYLGQLSAASNSMMCRPVHWFEGIQPSISTTNSFIFIFHPLRIPIVNFKCQCEI